MQSIESTKHPAAMPPQPPLPVDPLVVAVSPRQRRVAAVMLLVATLVWSFSFVWTKEALPLIGQALDRPPGDWLPAAALLSARFALGAAVWFAFIPAARRGWRRAGVVGSVLLGAALAGGLALQTVGLDLTSEAVSAFLTSLAIIFVPLMLVVAYRRYPAPGLLLGVALAVAGVWLLTGASFTSFGRGEWMGVACSVVFSVHLILLNRLGPTDSAWRLCGGQFAVVAVVMGVITLLKLPATSSIDPAPLMRFEVWGHLLLLVVGPTVLSFGMVMIYQPRLDPTRAAMIYLAEPILASMTAWLLVGRGLGPTALVGAGLILLANLVAELTPPARSRRPREGPAPDDRPSPLPALTPPDSVRARH